MFKIHIFQFIANILLKQQSLNEIRHSLAGRIQIWDQLFEQKILMYFNDFEN